ncbi:fungal trichothecene efflux pump [Stipitochalara longipes BDJ]|nr:fungal trichothecene efflux pump [Stipitochalara longipes BDJ]
MANSTSDAEQIATPIDHEKEGHSPVVQQVAGEGTFDIDAHDLPKGYFLSPSFIGTMLAVGLAFVGGAGTFSLVAPLLGVINDDIGPDPNYIWIALVITLTLSVGQVLVGRLSDLFGRRWFFILGSALALVGCIVSACATSVPMLIGGSVLVGFASAPQLSYTFVIGEIIPFKHRFHAQIYIYLWVTATTGFGPAIAYALVQHTKHTWRSCYYLMIAINAASTLCWYFCYFPPTFNDKYKHKKTKRQVLIDFDFVGLVLLVGGLLIFLMGISWGGSLYAWKSAHVIATIVVGFFALVVFVLYETLMPLNEPLIPMHLFKNGPWVATMMVVSLGASVYYAFAIVWPTMVFSLYTSDLTYGGWLCCVTGCGINAGQLSGGLLARYLGKQRTQIVAGSISMCAFLGACACATPDNKNTVIACMFIGTLSVGFLDSIGLTITGIAIKDQAEIGTAVGVAGSMRTFVSTIAQVVYTVILTNRLEQTIPREVPPALVSAGLPASSVPSFLSAITLGTPAAFAKVQGLTPSIEAIGVRAYKVASAHAYQTVFYSTIAFSGVCILCALFTPNVDDRMTDKVIVTLHRHHDTDEEIGEKTAAP